MQNVDAAGNGGCGCVVEVSAFSVVNVLTTQANGTHGFAAQAHVVVTRSESVGHWVHFGSTWQVIWSNTVLRVQGKAHVNLTNSTETATQVFNHAENDA